jgi:hypothetical protein
MSAMLVPTGEQFTMQPDPSAERRASDWGLLRLDPVLASDGRPYLRRSSQDRLPNVRSHLAEVERPLQSSKYLAVDRSPVMQFDQLPTASGDEFAFHFESRERSAFRLDIGCCKQLLLRSKPLPQGAGTVLFDAVFGLELTQAVEPALSTISARRTSARSRSSGERCSIAITHEWVRHEKLR